MGSRVQVEWYQHRGCIGGSKEEVKYHNSPTAGQVVIDKHGNEPQFAGLEIDICYDLQDKQWYCCHELSNKANTRTFENYIKVVIEGRTTRILLEVKDYSTNCDIGAVHDLIGRYNLTRRVTIVTFSKNAISDMVKVMGDNSECYYPLVLFVTTEKDLAKRAEFLKSLIEINNTQSHTPPVGLLLRWHKIRPNRNEKDCDEDFFVGAEKMARSFGFIPCLYSGIRPMDLPNIARARLGVAKEEEIVISFITDVPNPDMLGHRLVS
mmetsp:Transcript_24490/g.44173  ORF Transcript_24490/g.44173 Transcript_24490/m.44173 type:complete len:265 (+) Transcript_24490:139-933(+)|eukprot:CAMPEP_0196146164 /NCGR_PEP_ID=MMETSP0910-20130528/22339_1 /TAXON_ID=49265 /ORGANISM="Thalassiosira rotula, Strain GSO102" /LENGTH=264 /DNA_ID=CAMNT_0041408311 /DNA_START=40 /DNA_END=834 /DNA_ORIENTATION=+